MANDRVFSFVDDDDDDDDLKNSLLELHQGLPLAHVALDAQDRAVALALVADVRAPGVLGELGDEEDVAGLHFVWAFLKKRRERKERVLLEKSVGGRARGKMEKEKQKKASTLYTSITFFSFSFALFFFDFCKARHRKKNSTTSHHLPPQSKKKKQCPTCSSLPSPLWRSPRPSQGLKRRSSTPVSVGKGSAAPEERDPKTK